MQTVFNDMEKYCNWSKEVLSALVGLDGAGINLPDGLEVFSRELPTGWEGSGADDSKLAGLSHTPFLSRKLSFVWALSMLKGRMHCHMLTT